MHVVAPSHVDSRPVRVTRALLCVSQGSLACGAVQVSKTVPTPRSSEPMGKAGPRNTLPASLVPARTVSQMRGAYWGHGSRRRPERPRGASARPGLEG